MKKFDFCCWCEAKVKVPEVINPKKLLVCSKGCRDAEILFRIHYEDDEMNRRSHYQATMRGLADG